MHHSGGNDRCSGLDRFPHKCWAAWCPVSICCSFIVFILSDIVHWGLELFFNHRVPVSRISHLLLNHNGSQSLESSSPLTNLGGFVRRLPALIGVQTVHVCLFYSFMCQDNLFGCTRHQILMFSCIQVGTKLLQLKCRQTIVSAHVEKKSLGLTWEKF